MLQSNMNLAPEHSAVTNKRRRRDKVAKQVITAFGGTVLLTMVVLIWHLFGQASAILKLPSITAVGDYGVADGYTLLTADDVASGQGAVARGPHCELALMYLQGNRLQPSHPYKRPCEHQLQVFSELGLNYLADVSPRGLVRITSVRDLTWLKNTKLPLTSNLQTQIPLNLPELTFSLPQAQWQATSKWHMVMAGEWAVMQMTTPKGEVLLWVNRASPTRVVTQTIASGAQVLPLPGAEQVLVVRKETMQFLDLNSQILAVHKLQNPLLWMAALPKNRAILLSEKAGSVSRWTLRNLAGKLTYMPTYTMQIQKDEVPVSTYVHGNSNGAILLTDQGRVILFNRTTGEVLQHYGFTYQPIGVRWDNNHIYAYSDTHMSQLALANIAGITTYNSLFEAQQYEGYDSAETLWQTTSASDFQEAKLSLVPLIIGSVKASVLALIIAIPLSVGAAIYTAYFARSRIRHWLKPAIEMLEAIPSVLIGFIAAIWLAPIAEQFLFGFVFFIVTVPIIFLIVALIQDKFSLYFPPRIKMLAELLVNIFGIILLAYISVEWVPYWLFSLFGVESFNSLASATHVPVGKTTIVVAIALGVAIAPSIYSLADDAISGVPNNLKKASFALGATQLQTLRSVVLHVAMPGIIAAVMLGFGRAFGETMIVLMVTGNTPIADWSLLEGLRALTANLAIELPEAEVGSIHYQVLFLTACLLFAFTFVVNTLAELLRQRLRRNMPNG
jgi:phosphate transport system permease protein